MASQRQSLSLKVLVARSTATIVVAAADPSAAATSFIFPACTATICHVYTLANLQALELKMPI